jgi:magnesium transporter
MAVVLRLFTKGPDDTLVERVLQDPLDMPATGWRWLDATNPATDEVFAVGRALGLDALVVEDVVEPTLSPKVDDHGEYLLVVLHELALTDERIATHELDAILFPDLLVSFHAESLPALEWVISQGTTTAQMAEGGPDRMLARLAEAVTRRYMPVVEEMEERVEDLEERAILADRTVIPEVLALRRDAVTLRRILAPQRDAAVEISRSDHPLVTDRARRRFADVFDTTAHAAEALDSARLLLASILETYRSTVAERTNEAMQTLTVFAAIMLPLSLLAGIYGMNFADMPELGWRWGYFAVLGIMAVVAIGLWLYFARRGFVGSPRLRRVPIVLVRGLGRGARGVAGLATAPVNLVVQGFRRNARPESPGDDPATQ